MWRLIECTQNGKDFAALGREVFLVETCVLFIPDLFLPR